MRARAPYRVRNAITGVILTGMVVGVWAYSMSAVKQDVFDDIDEEAKRLSRPSTVMQNVKKPGAPNSSPSTGAGPPAVSSDGNANVSPGVGAALAPTEKHPVRGVLPVIIGGTFPRFLDPKTNTFVWGAPPVDNIGKLGSPSAGRAPGIVSSSSQDRLGSSRVNAVKQQ